MPVLNSSIQSKEFCLLLRELVGECYENSKSKGFWTGPENDNIPTKIVLMHSELSEMLEAFRKFDPQCDKEITINVYPEKESEYPAERRITSMEEEVADLFIRLCDMCGRLNINLGEVVLAKMKYNLSRPHMHGNKRC